MEITCNLLALVLQNSHPLDLQTNKCDQSEIPSNIMDLSRFHPYTPTIAMKKDNINKISPALVQRLNLFITGSCFLGLNSLGRLAGRNSQLEAKSEFRHWSRLEPGISGIALSMC